MSLAEAAPPLARAEAGGRVAMAGIGVAVAALLLPLVSFRRNRILSGQALHFWEIESPTTWFAIASTVVLALGALLAGRAAIRAALAFAAIGAVAIACGLAASAILPDQGFARVSFGPGFWLAVVALAVAATDALVAMNLRPIARIAVLTAILAATFALFASGVLGDLSLAREYAAYRAEFWPAGRDHLFLVAASILPALVVGLPLGRWAYRSDRARGVAFAILNTIQTTPSVALFAVLMVPLTSLVVAFPRLREMGVQGIGTTPAVIALFLYALLPVTASSFAAFRSVEPSVIEVGRAMGMTRGQLLGRVEIPLGLPVFLAGVRVALVQNIGLATIAALVGGGGFGTLVFRGMGQAALDLSLLGALPIVVLSLVAVIVFDATIDALRRGDP